MARRPHQAGMTLVELMVGLAIGLFIVVTALGLVMRQLQDQRALLHESRLRINLDLAADLIVRDLRRAGFRGDPASAIAREGSPAAANPFADLSWSDDTAALQLAYARAPTSPEAIDSDDRFRFGLRDGAVTLRIGNGTVQDVTDPAVLTVTAFSLTPIVEDLPLGAFCDQPCPAADPQCPRQQVRRYDLTLTARSATDPSIARTLGTSVRVRNDVVSGACPE